MAYSKYDKTDMLMAMVFADGDPYNSLHRNGFRHVYPLASGEYTIITLQP